MATYQYKWYDPFLNYKNWNIDYNNTGRYQDWRTTADLNKEFELYKDHISNGSPIGDDITRLLSEAYSRGYDLNTEATEDEYKFFYWMKMQNERERLNQALRDGSITGLDYQGEMSGLGFQLSPEELDYMNNIIAQEEALRQNQETRDLRDTSITSAAQQYSSLGFNPAAVMSTGGVSAGGLSSANMTQNNPGMLSEQLKAQAKQKEFDRKAAMAQTLLGMTGKMAASGIGGAAYGLARGAVRSIASQTAHSALSMFN